MVTEQNTNSMLEYLRQIRIDNPRVLSILSQNHNKKDIKIEGRWQPTPTDTLNYDYHITTSATDNMLTIQGYNVTLFQIPEIKHGIYSGIDTAALHHRMADTEWDHVYAKGNPTSDLYVMEIVDDLLILKQSGTEPANIAEQLMIRYLVGTALEEHLMSGIDKTPYQYMLQLPLNGNINDIDLAQAYHLLCGGAVMQLQVPLEGQQESEYFWVIAENGKLLHLPDFDIISAIKEIPLANGNENPHIEDLLLSICNGEQPAVKLKKDDHLINAFIKADPRNATIAVRENNQPIQNVSIQRKLNKSTSLKTPIKMVNPQFRGRGL